jgi:hypothetical protein
MGIEVVLECSTPTCLFFLKGMYNESLQAVCEIIIMQTQFPLGQAMGALSPCETTATSRAPRWE